MRAIAKIEIRKEDESAKELMSAAKQTTIELGTLLGLISGEIADSKLVHSAIRRALWLNQNLQFFSGSSFLKKEVHDLSQLVLDVVDTVEQWLTNRSAEFQVFVEADVYFEMDIRTLQNALLNLVEFVRQNTQNLSTKILVRLVQKNGKIEFNVELPEEDHPFSNVRNQLEYKIADGIIAQHGGQLQRLKNGVSVTWPSQNHKEVTYPIRRNFRRVGVNLESLMHVNGKTLKGHIEVLSLGGCLIALKSQDIEVDVDGTVQIEIFFLDSFSLKFPMNRVASIARTPDGLSLGLEFREIDQKQRTILSSVVAALSDRA